ncbi:hypothetical protein [Virgisporangium aurantiacum]|nr:hypothetical protein [Virgisporangium aurantiacum]
MSESVTLPDAALALAPSEEKYVAPFQDIRPLDIPPQRSSSAARVDEAVDAWARQPMADRDRLEAAVHVLRDLVALFEQLIVDKEAEGDLSEAGQLRAQQRRLLREQRDLRVEHTVQIDQVLTTYRDELRKLTETPAKHVANDGGEAACGLRPSPRVL